MNSIPLWHIPFYQFGWDQHSQHQEQLKNNCRDLEKQQQVSDTATTVKHGLYESTFDYCRQQEPAVQALTKFFQNSVYQAAADANKKYWSANMRIGVNITESWCHITRTGGYHDSHHHPNSSWSGIYYIDCGDIDYNTKSGVNRFYRPADPAYQDPGTQWITGSNSIDIQAQPGMLIVFPSWIKHCALPYHGASERFVVAFNSQIIAL
jgi:uncharacterized protein (TIGR02466 family)